MDTFPPRGSRRLKSSDAAPRGYWCASDELDHRWLYDEQNTQDAVLLGRNDQGQFLGLSSDRHIVTIAGSRTGKSGTVLIPNLLRYRGSAIVVDPKGELAMYTANARSEWSDVFVLNPFKAEGWDSHQHDPFQELKRSAIPSADAAQLADALIIGNEKDPHWTDSAKNLLTGIILHLLTTDPGNLSIPMLRHRMTGTPIELVELFKAMRENPSLGGIIQNIGSSMYGKFRWKDGIPEPSDEMSSILSTANEQTRPLDDLAEVFSGHDFFLDELSRRRKPVTVYLILPATRIATHARWLRLFIYQVLAAMERNPMPRGRSPVWLVLEEFAALGHMRGLETAAGYFAGFGIKLWTILQDLTQIKTHYPKSWETFLGNAGIIQAFGVVDLTTTKYLSDLLGQTTITEYQRSFVSSNQVAQGNDGLHPHPRSVPLLTPSEIAYYFAKDTNRQMVLAANHLPIFMNRLEDARK